MSNTSTLDGDQAEPGALENELFRLADDTEAAETPAPAFSAPWQPGPPSFGTPAKQNEGAKKKKSARAKAEKPVKGKRAAAIAEHGYVPLPEPKAAKKLSKGAQKKAEKAELVKQGEAIAARIRINGSDEDVEVPKKPWLEIFNGKRARPDEIAETLTDLASMLENGESEKQSVKDLADQYSNYDIGQAYERVYRLLDLGVSLNDAMADQTDAFPPVVRELLGAAKMPKDMHRNLRQAALIVVEADNIKGKVKSALFKPGFMAVFLALFTVAAVQFLLPMTTTMFTGIGAKPPATTTLIIAVGGIVKWFLLALLVIAGIAGMAWKLFLKNNDRVATRMDKFAIEAPLFGDIIRMSSAARFCDVLSSCLAVGMSEVESLETAGRACGNRALATWVEDHVGRQRVGVVEFGDVAKTEMFPWNLRNRIQTTNSLVRRIEILRELGASFHEKSQERLNRFAERIGPLSEGVMVIVVVFVVLLVVFPILTFIPTMIKTVS